MTLETLKNYGADVEDGLKRCLNNEYFYLRCIGIAVKDNGFVALGDALSANDLDKAFDEAHKLKGVLANLSITPIYRPIAELTELLRRKTPGDYAGLFAEIMAKRDALVGLLEK